MSEQRVPAQSTDKHGGAPGDFRKSGVSHEHHSATLSGLHISSKKLITLTSVDGRINSVEFPQGLSGTETESTTRRAVPKGKRVRYISTGFFDIQVNGYQGVDYSSPDLSVNDVRSVVDGIAKSGTTRHLPTIITNPRQQIIRNLSVIADAISQDPALKFRVPGIHVEGPFISSEEGARGAHDLRHVRVPSIEELNEWIRASRGQLRLVTLAPELPGSAAAIRFLSDKGIRVAIGHTSAQSSEISSAVEAGATLSTHLGNASPAMLPRLDNHIWCQLANDNLFASIIADGFHLPPDVVRVFSRAKGRDRLILVSDVAPFAGSKPGTYKWGGISVEVRVDNSIGLMNTNFLAGAGHLLDWDIGVFARSSKWSIGEVVELATVAPVRYIFGDDFPGNRKPELVEVGQIANYVEFDYTTDSFDLVVRKVATPDRVYSVS